MKRASYRDILEDGGLQGNMALSIIRRQLSSFMLGKEW